MSKSTIMNSINRMENIPTCEISNQILYDPQTQYGCLHLICRRCAQASILCPICKIPNIRSLFNENVALSTLTVSQATRKNGRTRSITRIQVNMISAVLRRSLLRAQAWASVRRGVATDMITALELSLVEWQTEIRMDRRRNEFEIRHVLKKYLQNTVSKNSVPKKDEKLKQNYCYVCKVQCTAPRNFKDHLKGKKHLKNVRLQELKDMRKNQNDNSTKKTISRKEHGRAAAASKLNFDRCDEGQNMSNSTNNTSPIDTSSNSNRPPQYKSRYNSTSPEFDSRSARYNNNTQNMYQRNEERYLQHSYNDSWNKRFPNDFQNWDYNNGFNYDSRNQHRLHFQYNAPHPSNYCSQIRTPDYNPYKNSSNNFSNFADNCENHNGSEIPVENRLVSSDSDYLKVTIPNSANLHSINAVSSNSETYSRKETLGATVDNINKTDSAEISRGGSNRHEQSSSISKLIASTYVSRQRTRSRSLSSSESEKRKNDENPAEPDASEEQRIKEWTNSLLETNNNQISRLINPSNFKEKAVVNRLITELSKSKRKENLTRTLRSNSLESPENNEEDTDQTARCKETSVSVDFEDRSSNFEFSESPAGSKSRRKSSGNEGSKKLSKSNGKIIDNSLPILSYQEKYGKRKLSDSDVGVGKKQRASSVESLEKTTTVGQDSDKGAALSGSSFKLPEMSKASGETSSDFLSNLTREVMELCVENSDMSSNLPSSDSILAQTLACSSEIPVDTLIQLFASGTVKVKEEFNDPVVDALKEISPDELISACSNLPFNASSSSDKTLENQPTETTTAQQNKDGVSPVIMGSAVIHDEVNSSTLAHTSSQPLQNSSSVGSEGQQSVSSTDDNSSHVTMSGTEELNLPSQTQSESLPPFKFLIEKLQEISTEEETVKQNLTEAKAKITEFASLLEQWKSRKKELQEQEEVLRKKRNDIINAMHVAVKINGNEPEEEPAPLPQKNSPAVQRAGSLSSENQPVVENTCKGISFKRSSVSPSLASSNRHTIEENAKQSSNSKRSRTSSIASNSSTETQEAEENYSKERCPANSTVPSQLDNPSSSEMQTTIKNEANLSKILVKSMVTRSSSEKQISEKNLNNRRNLKTTDSVPLRHLKKRKCESLKSTPSDEVILLPSPVKPPPLEIVIIDDDDDVAPLIRNETVSNPATDKRVKLSDFKNLHAHVTIVNCLVVFEDFLYTCSNDGSAKRFSLKDASQKVMYVHSSKNVTEIVVEKVQNEALVFTSCSSRVISLFIASSGTRIKTFYPPCAVMSICKGWGKFYSGLVNGTVNVYNWKHEEIEIVKSEKSISRISTAHQGRLHVLIILSREGNISITDAETGLLIRYIKVSIRHPSWMCLHSDLVYLSSSDKSLIVLDIMSGKEDKRLHLTGHTTGLAVCDNHIFTISYAGVVSCFHKDKIAEKKMFYGAGQNSLTCIHVHQNWVFTGNRKGCVSMFHFDPYSSAVCEFAKCGTVFGLKDDLEYHVQKDHLEKKKYFANCNWGGCAFAFPSNANNVDKLNHIKTHIYET